MGSPAGGQLRRSIFGRVSGARLCPLTSGWTAPEDVREAGLSRPRRRNTELHRIGGSQQALAQGHGDGHGLAGHAVRPHRTEASTRSQLAGGWGGV